MIGCQDNPLNSNTEFDQVSEDPGGQNSGVVPAAKFDFSARGFIEKIDVRDRVIQLNGDGIGDQPRTFLVGKNSSLLFHPAEITIPFAFKYLEEGDLLIICGHNSGMERVGTLFELFEDNVPIVADDAPAL
jgi:hypothetical protein